MVQLFLRGGSQRLLLINMIDLYLKTSLGLSVVHKVTIAPDLAVPIQLYPATPRMFYAGVRKSLLESCISTTCSRKLSEKKKKKSVCTLISTTFSHQGRGCFQTNNRVANRVLLVFVFVFLIAIFRDLSDCNVHKARNMARLLPTFPRLCRNPFG